ncbi:hypothetical protein [Kitasatospora sp. NPDC005856]|uniref:hypothetical protein n=1 Tax=Kitasatospora sp. NPDC005856 TaxID=3154566 RepID=UPI0033EB6311
MLLRTMTAAAILTFCAPSTPATSAQVADPNAPIWTAPAAKDIPIWTASGQ